MSYNKEECIDMILNSILRKRGPDDIMVGAANDKEHPGRMDELRSLLGSDEVYVTFDAYTLESTTPGQLFRVNVYTDNRFEKISDNEEQVCWNEVYDGSAKTSFYVTGFSYVSLSDQQSSDLLEFARETILRGEETYGVLNHLITIIEIGEI